MSQTRVRDKNNNQIPYAQVFLCLTGTDNPLASRICDPVGNTSWDELDPHEGVPYNLIFKAEGFKSRMESYDTVFKDIEIQLEKIEQPPPPVTGEHGPLHLESEDTRKNQVQRGEIVNFMDEDNHPWCMKGYTIHTIMCALRDGNPNAVRDILGEAKTYGANTIISIGTHLSDWKKDNGFLLNPLDPNYKNWLSQYFDILEDEKLRGAHACLADAQGLTLSEKQYIWQMTCDIAKNRWNIMPRKGNEFNVNGWHPSELPNHDTGNLHSQGSSGEGNPTYQNALEWGEWEPRRDSDRVFKSLDDAGAGVLELQHGYGGAEGKVGPFPIPLVIIEPPFFHSESPDFYGDERWTNKNLALNLGVQIGSSSAGGAWGSSESCVARIQNPTVQEQCALFFRGLNTGFQR